MTELEALSLADPISDPVDSDCSDMSIIIPWRPNGSTLRERAHQWVCEQLALAFPGAEILSCAPDSASPFTPWCKAEAIMRGVAQSTRSVIVMHDADVWTEPKAVRASVDAVLTGAARWALPHLWLMRLDSYSTNLLYLHDGLYPYEGMSTVQIYPGHAGGGIVVISKDDIVSVPPDPRFRGWGQEDDAWAIALRVILGQEQRGAANMFHLWHEPEIRLSRATGSASGRELFNRYLEAKASADPMGAVTTLIRDAWEGRS